MPGPVSDPFNPEWGTAANAQEIAMALQTLYDKLTSILGNQKPMYVLDLVRADLPERIRAGLSEKEWRLLRFAIERAMESL